MGRLVTAAMLFLVIAAGCLGQADWSIKPNTDGELGPSQGENSSRIGPDGPSESAYSPPAGCGMLNIHVLNVSQADAILIITPSNRTILVDSGSLMKKDSATKVMEYLDSMGIKRIDYLIATHYHEDHIGGMESVASALRIGTFISNGNCGSYKSATAQKLITLASSLNSTIVKTDMDLPPDPCMGQERLIVAYDRPEGCWPSSSDTSNENENSILLRLVYGNTSFLLASDCETGCEAELLRQGTFLRSDVLKVGHHGSGTSSSDAFLSAVGAEKYVISVDKNRSVIDGYYHPRLDTLSRIYEHGGGIGNSGSQGNTFRTDSEGDVDFVSDGKTITALARQEASDCDIFSGYGGAQTSSYGKILQMLGRCG
jgi:competence protein ComEC